MVVFRLICFGIPTLHVPKHSTFYYWSHCLLKKRLVFHHVSEPHLLTPTYRPLPLHQILTSAFLFWKSLQIFQASESSLSLSFLSGNCSEYPFSVTTYGLQKRLLFLKELSLPVLPSRVVLSRSGYIIFRSINCFPLLFSPLKTTGTLLYFLLHELLFLSQVAIPAFLGNSVSSSKFSSNPSPIFG